MKNSLNIKTFLILLLLTLSLTSVSKVLASSAWPIPLPPFPGGSGTNGYISNGAIGCGILCEMFGGTCEASYEAKLVTSSGTVADLFDTVSICSSSTASSTPGDNPGGDSITVNLIIVRPTQEEFSDLYNENGRKPVDVNVIMKWQTTKFEGDYFKRCEASGKWTGSKKPGSGAELLEKVNLSPGDAFQLDCFYDETNGDRVIERKIIATTSLGYEEGSIIFDSGLGGTILEHKKVTGVTTLVVSMYNEMVNMPQSMITDGRFWGGALESAGDALMLTPAGVEAGAGAVVVGVLEKYAFMRTGIKAVKTWPKLIYKFCGFKSCARVVDYLKIGKIIESAGPGKVVDLSKLSAEELGVLEDFLVKQTAKIEIEFGVKFGKLFTGTKEAVIIAMSKLGGISFHTHLKQLTPSGPLLKSGVDLLKAELQSLGIISKDDLVKYGAKAIRANKGISGDMAAALDASEKSFRIGTLTPSGEVVKRVWNTLTPEKQVEALLVDIKDYIRVGKVNYNPVAMDAAWGGRGWVDYYLQTGLK